MRENVTVSHRGASYEIGRGYRFYGIWPVGSPVPQPMQWWPETDEGWHAAWFRFTQLESPEAIVPADVASQHGGWPQPAGQPDVTWPARSWPATGLTSAPGSPGLPRSSAIASAILLGAGVICGAAGLFGGYLGSASLASQSAQWLPHAIYLAAWSAAAVLIFLGAIRLRAGAGAGGGWQRTGALLAAGVSAVTFGFFLADLGTVVSGGATAGSGLILSFAGWLACAAGSAVAVWPRPGSALGRPQRRGHQAAPLVTVILAGLGAAITFAPPWDSFTIRTATGATQTITQGNAFGVPAPVIAGNVAVMIAIVAVIVAAGLWRPARAGAVLLAGAAVPLVAQALSALVQASQPTTPAQFGISRGEAAALGISISSGLTLAFWIYCLFLVALALSCALLATGSDQALPARPIQTQPIQTRPIQTQPGQTEPGLIPQDQAPATAADAPSSGFPATDAETAAL